MMGGEADFYSKSKDEKELRSDCNRALLSPRFSKLAQKGRVNVLQGLALLKLNLKGK